MIFDRILYIQANIELGTGCVRGSNFALFPGSTFSRTLNCRTYIWLLIKMEIHQLPLSQQKESHNITAVMTFSPGQLNGLW